MRRKTSYYMNTSCVYKRSGWTLSYTVITSTSIVDGHFKYAELSLTICIGGFDADKHALLCIRTCNF